MADEVLRPGWIRQKQKIAPPAATERKSKSLDNLVSSKPEKIQRCRLQSIGKNPRAHARATF
jgi:hypothetical protein